MISRSVAAKAALLVILMLSCVSQARAEVFSADAVKAAYLYRFASYVEWPAESIPSSSSSPFVIAVIDAEDVANHLEALLGRTKLNGRPVEARRITRVSELDGVHILYIGPRALAQTRGLRAAAASRPILLVTDDEKGIDSGAIINFVEVTRNVRFEVSLAATDRARLKINSALLSVAARVERRPQTAVPCTAGPATRHRRPGCVITMASAPAGLAR
jgi:hypothetical protein